MSASEIFTALFWIFSAALGGAALDRILRLRLDQLGAAKWPAFILVFCFSAFLFCIQPVASIAIALVLYGLSRITQSGDVSARENSRGLPIVTTLMLFALVRMTRPAALLYWDESGRLGMARLGVNELSGIRAAVLDPLFSMFPVANPVFLPVGAALFSGSESIAALLVSFAVIQFTILAVFICLSWGHFKNWGIIPALGLFLIPFSFLHLHTAYADLSLGLVVAALALLLARNRFLLNPVSLVFAMCAVSIKNDGIAPILALIFTTALLLIRDRRGFDFYKMLPLWILSFLPLAIWRFQLFQNGIQNSERRFALDNLGKMISIFWDGFLRHAVDLQTWGIFWGLVAGAFFSLPMVWIRLREDTRFLATFSVSYLIALFCSVLFAPAAVYEHVTNYGTITNRLLLQTVPAVLVFAAAFLRDLSLPTLRASRVKPIVEPS